MKRFAAGGWSMQSSPGHSSSGRSKRANERPLLLSVTRRFGADHLLKILAFLAAAGAELRQNRELFPGLLHIAGFDIELAEVFAGSLMLGLHLQRLGVVGQRCLEVAGFAQREAEEIINVGVLDVLRER